MVFVFLFFSPEIKNLKMSRYTPLILTRVDRGQSCMKDVGRGMKSIITDVSNFIEGIFLLRKCIMLLVCFYTIADLIESCVF